MTDETGTVLVTVLIGPVRRSLDHDPNWLALYPSPPESVHVGSLPGTLRYRRRDRDGGAYDGWALNVSSEALSLTVLVSDKGEDHGRWERWKPNVLSVEWKPQDVDAEKAFGLTAGTIPAMELEKAGAGALSYRAQPPDADGVTLLINSFPAILPEAPETCFELLRKSAAHVGNVGRPSPFKENGFHGCEMDSSSANGRSMYWAIVGAPDARGTVAALGDAPSSSFAEWRPRFAAAVRSLRSTR